jgi:hypothetical protein
MVPAMTVTRRSAMAALGNRGIDGVGLNPPDQKTCTSRSG